MSIEYRAALNKDIKLSSTTLKHGTVVYVEETEHGWVAKQYGSNPTSAGGIVFALEPGGFLAL